MSHRVHWCNKAGSRHSHMWSAPVRISWTWPWICIRFALRDIRFALRDIRFALISSNLRVEISHLVQSFIAQLWNAFRLTAHLSKAFFKSRVTFQAKRRSSWVIGYVKQQRGSQSEKSSAKVSLLSSMEKWEKAVHSSNTQKLAHLERTWRGLRFDVSWPLRFCIASVGASAKTSSTSLPRQASLEHSESWNTLTFALQKPRDDRATLADCFVQAGSKVSASEANS